MKSLLGRRSAGILLHPSSLPGPAYCGDFGADARRFVDLVADAGLQIWQVLPLGPTHEDGCPYQSFSVHAGNPDLIDLHWLTRQGWLTREQAEDLERLLSASAALEALLDSEQDNEHHSHDLRNVLGAMRGYAELLGEDLPEGGAAMDTPERFFSTSFSSKADIFSALAR